MTLKKSSYLIISYKDFYFNRTIYILCCVKVENIKQKLCNYNKIEKNNTIIILN